MSLMAMAWKMLSGQKAQRETSTRAQFFPSSGAAKVWKILKTGRRKGISYGGIDVCLRVFSPPGTSVAPRSNQPAATSAPAGEGAYIDALENLRPTEQFETPEYTRVECAVGLEACG
jgi:hypothetical protein